VSAKRHFTLFNSFGRVHVGEEHSLQTDGLTDGQTDHATVPLVAIAGIA